MISKLTRSVVTKSKERPIRKMMSATFSKRSLESVLLRIERNESTLLAINKINATEVISSITVFPFRFNTFSEVITMKQSPSKFDEAFKIFGTFPYCSFPLFNIPADNFIDLHSAITCVTFPISVTTL